jgi:hypothetical protein
VVDAWGSPDSPWNESEGPWYPELAFTMNPPQPEQAVLLASEAFQEDDGFEKDRAVRDMLMECCIERIQEMVQNHSCTLFAYL